MAGIAHTALGGRANPFRLSGHIVPFSGCNDEETREETSRVSVIFGLLGDREANGQSEASCDSGEVVECRR